MTTAAFQADVAEMKLYAERKTGFENLDEFQLFTPGLYVIGAMPATGKTTFCWQLLEQLARKGETCIYVRKLKKFQRDTNTTFIVISSFNRTNYAQSVSFESFKESGNIEYTADVVWALQLNLMNEIKGGELVSETRRKIDEAKKQQPRQIHLKCLKNRQGTNYDCFFEYHSAHDCFEACDMDDFKDDLSFSGDDDD